MKYKSGDKVKIKSLDWYKANECSGRVMCDGLAFLEMMTEWCGKELTIDLIYTDERGSGYIMKEPKIQWRFTDGMIDDIVDAEPREKMVSLGKVIEYLEANFPDIENVGRQYKESFIRNFRKAMEE